MEYAIRTATIEDLDKILEFNHKLSVFENKNWDPTIDPDYSYSTEGKEGFKKCIEGEDSLILIVEFNSTSVGYLAGGKTIIEDYRFSENTYEVGSMYLDEEHRGKGLGGKLLAEFEVWAKGKGADRLKLVASVKNSNAVNAYRKAGFNDYDLTLEKKLRN